MAHLIPKNPFCKGGPRIRESLKKTTGLIIDDPESLASKLPKVYTYNSSNSVKQTNIEPASKLMNSTSMTLILGKSQ